MTIKELRKQQNLSQAAFAERIGVKAATVSQLENGRMKVSPKIAAAVKEAFGAEVESGETVKPAAKKLEIYIQSPYGGNITPEEVAAKMPEDTESCFVRVDQNLIWWVRPDGETGAVEIWNDRA